MTTWTSALSHGRTSIEPSNVVSATSGLPETAKCFSSRSTYLFRSAPTMSTHPGAASSAANAAGSASPLMERTDRAMSRSSAGLDGKGEAGVRGEGHGGNRDGGTESAESTRRNEETEEYLCFSVLNR